MSIDKKKDHHSAGNIRVADKPTQIPHERLPLSNDACHLLQVKRAALRTSELQRQGTVLVIDDDNVVLEIATIFLSRLGYSVLTALDGIQAIEVFQLHKSEILLVLSDFVMPRLNGMETLQELRKIAPDVPMILASGYSKEYAMSGEFTEQPACFLNKPYTIQELKDAIDFALNNT